MDAIWDWILRCVKYVWEWIKPKPKNYTKITIESTEAEKVTAIINAMRESKKDELGNDFEKLKKENVWLKEQLLGTSVIAAKASEALRLDEEIQRQLTGIARTSYVDASKVLPSDAPILETTKLFALIRNCKRCLNFQHPPIENGPFNSGYCNELKRNVYLHTAKKCQHFIGQLYKDKKSINEIL